jgi:DNA-binding NarL/FixJ family response regulator
MTEETAGRTSVLVVDDHKTFAELLTGALDREPDLAGLGYAADAAGGVSMALALHPDVVVMDYHLPDTDGLDAAAQILTRAPDTRVVMLTADPSPEALEQAAALGVAAFLPKDGSLAVLLQTLRQAHSGSMIVHPALLARLVAGLQNQSTGPPVPALTQRETDVLALMAAGHDVRTNARILGISASTCRGYTKSILAKLGAHSQLEAVVAATRQGLLPPQQP